MRGYYEEMRTILERHGGTVEKFIGDAVMAVFGVPVAHEDDALRAVRAAWEMRAAVPALGLRARIGVNTGEVVAGEGDSLVTGDAVNVAARLEQAADAGRRADRRRDAQARPRRGRRSSRSRWRRRASRNRWRPSGCSTSTRRPTRSRAGSTRRSSAAARELEQLRQAFERTVARAALPPVHAARRGGRRQVAARRRVARRARRDGAARALPRLRRRHHLLAGRLGAQAARRAGGTRRSSRIVEGASRPNELFWAVRAQLEEVALERPLVVVLRRHPVG